MTDIIRYAAEISWRVNYIMHALPRNCSAQRRSKMKLNAKTALLSRKILLVPYEPHHVRTYSAWMQDEELRKATASERLTLEEEFEMQQKWRLDADKLTFITCLPPAREVPLAGCVLSTQDDAPKRMLGDVNLFLSEDDGEEGENGQKRMVGEVELMIARKGDQGKGFGRASLLLFIHYILRHREEIMKEWLETFGTALSSTLLTLRAKIAQTNDPSIKLFESVGFIKGSDEPNYFGEFELVLQAMDLENIESLMKGCGIEEWREASYENTPYMTLRRMGNLF